MNPALSYILIAFMPLTGVCIAATPVGGRLQIIIITSQSRNTHTRMHTPWHRLSKALEYVCEKTPLRDRKEYRKYMCSTVCLPVQMPLLKM